MDLSNTDSNSYSNFGDPMLPGSNHGTGNGFSGYNDRLGDVDEVLRKEISNVNSSAMMDDKSFTSPRQSNCSQSSVSYRYSEQQQPRQQQMSASSSIAQSMAAVSNQHVHVVIEEQPRARGLRFRYECEGRSAGSIPGEKSSEANRTYPSIKIMNLKDQPAIVVVSCVTRDDPPRPHPHSLVGKDCNKGVCTVKIRRSGHNPIISFPNIGIQCAKKKDVENQLNMRQSIRVDPFNTGFQHKNSNIDLNVVKLCYQVFLHDKSSKKFQIPLEPVTSQTIFDKKAVNDLVISRISKSSGSASGGDEVFLLCEKVNKEDIEVRFFQEDSDGLVWEGFGSFGQVDVHRQYAIVFRTPPYLDPYIKTVVTVYVQLKRRSDGETSDPRPFQYYPDDSDSTGIELKRKRKRLDYYKFMPDGNISSYLSDAGSDLHNLADRQLLKQRLRAKASVQTKDGGMSSQSNQDLSSETSLNQGYSSTVSKNSPSSSLSSKSVFNPSQRNQFSEPHHLKNQYSPDQHSSSGSGMFSGVRSKNESSGFRQNYQSTRSQNVPSSSNYSKSLSSQHKLLSNHQQNMDAGSSSRDEGFRTDSHSGNTYAELTPSKRGSTYDASTNNDTDIGGYSSSSAFLNELSSNSDLLSFLQDYSADSQAQFLEGSNIGNRDNQNDIDSCATDLIANLHLHLNSLNG